jgi:hypothetical protein
MRPGKRCITDKYGSRGRRLATISILLRSVITTISCPAWLFTLSPNFLRPSKISAIICVADPLRRGHAVHQGGKAGCTFGVTSIRGILFALTICCRRIQRSSKSKNCPTPHYGRENNRFQDSFGNCQMARFTGLEHRATGPKNNAPNEGGTFRAINAPPRTLNVHKFPFMGYRQQVCNFLL